MAALTPFPSRRDDHSGQHGERSCGSGSESAHQPRVRPLVPKLESATAKTRAAGLVVLHGGGPGGGGGRGGPAAAALAVALGAAGA